MIDIDTSPLVSVIISTYNGAKHITETIDSVRNQTYANWEMIIVDDGSDDNTCDIVNGIPDQRIRLHKAGRVGVNGRIKNIALSKLSGQLIAFLDHDDLWATTKLEKQVAALQQYPEAGFCLTGGYNFKKRGEPFSFFYKEREGIRSDHLFFSFFQSRVAAWTQALLVRKHCVEYVGLFSETSLPDDAGYVIELSRHFKGVILYEPLTYHRLHETNHSMRNWVLFHRQGLATIRKYMDAKLLPATLARDALFRSHINFGEKYLLLKESRKAIQHFYEAWKNKPVSIVPLKKTVKALLHSFKK